MLSREQVCSLVQEVVASLISFRDEELVREIRDYHLEVYRHRDMTMTWHCSGSGCTNHQSVDSHNQHFQTLLLSAIIPIKKHKTQSQTSEKRVYGLMHRTINTRFDTPPKILKFSSFFEKSMMRA
jgi:hypothetical protein